MFLYLILTAAFVAFHAIILCLLIVLSIIVIIYFLRGKSMTAATFSADGSILAVAAETVITLWDPDRNYLVAVVGETYMVNSVSFCLTYLLCMHDEINCSKELDMSTSTEILIEVEILLSEHLFWS